MERKRTARPGRPAKDKRISVLLSQEQHEAFMSAMDKEGISASAKIGIWVRRYLDGKLD